MQRGRAVLFVCGVFFVVAVVHFQYWLSFWNIAASDCNSWILLSSCTCVLGKLSVYPKWMIDSEVTIRESFSFHSTSLTQVKLCTLVTETKFQISFGCLTQVHHFTSSSRSALRIPERACLLSHSGGQVVTSLMPYQTSHVAYRGWE